MSQANYVHVYNSERLKELRATLTDYLFDRGYSITKPMIDDLALLTSDLIDKYSFNATITTSSQQNTAKVGEQDA